MTTQTIFSIEQILTTTRTIFSIEQILTIISCSSLKLSTSHVDLLIYIFWGFALMKQNIGKFRPNSLQLIFAIFKTLISQSTQTNGFWC